MNSLRLSWLPLITAVFLLGCGETKPPEPPESPESQLISGFNPTDAEASSLWLRSLVEEYVGETNPLAREEYVKRLDLQLNELRNTKVFWKQTVYNLFADDSSGPKYYYVNSFLPPVSNVEIEYYDTPREKVELSGIGTVRMFQSSTRYSNSLPLEVYKTFGKGDLAQTEAIFDRAAVFEYAAGESRSIKIIIFFRHLKFIAPSE